MRATNQAHKPFVPLSAFALRSMILHAPALSVPLRAESCARVTAYYPGSIPSTSNIFLVKVRKLATSNQLRIQRLSGISRTGWNILACHGALRLRQRLSAPFALRFGRLCANFLPSTSFQYACRIAGPVVVHGTSVPVHRPKSKMPTYAIDIENGKS